MSTTPDPLPVTPTTDQGAKPCGCGMTRPTNFPRDEAKGDRCPIGPLGLHHWHGDDCVFCGRFRRG